MIFSGGLASGKFLITFIAIISTGITAGYYLWFLWRVFFGATPRKLENTKEASWMLRIPIIVLAATALVLGIWPNLILRFIA